MMTVFVFLIVNIVDISCSDLILSNTKYAKYNYEEIYIKEQCLSKIELVYSNILKEVEIALNESEDFDSFQNYFTNNNSSDFIAKISDISSSSLKDTTCSVYKLENNYDKENSIYYRIKSEVKYNTFRKIVVADIKIKNPFQNKESSEDNQKQIKPSDLILVFDCKEV